MMEAQLQGALLKPGCAKGKALRGFKGVGPHDQATRIC